MPLSVCVLGRQPALGLAELESLYGAKAVSQVSLHAAGITLDVSEINFARLGGSTKLAKVIGTAPSASWKLIEKELVKISHKTTLTTGLQATETGKFNIGLSALGLDVTPAKLTALGLTLKKILRTETRSVRIVPNQTAELSTAQVYHNHLTDERGAEILLIAAADSSVIIARTTAVQDIDSYTLRDRGRPKRDARVGMLPPKLAQIIINLATADRIPLHGSVILDPFCGTGVVLIEATMMGFDIYGSDIDSRMIEYTDQNLMWLLDVPSSPVSRPPESSQDESWRYFKLEAGDATTHQWNPTPNCVAGETYLGRPFTAVPSRDILEQTVSEVNLILKKFLRNIHAQLTPGTRLCLAVPAWQISPNRFRHLPLIDSLVELGYERTTFQHVKASDLLYYREGQIVARELLVIKRA